MLPILGLNGHLIVSMCELVNFNLTRKSSSIVIASSGNFPSDFEQLTYADLGDFDKCLDLGRFERSQNLNVHPQYCTFSLLPDYKKLVDRNFTQERIDKLFRIEFTRKNNQLLTIGLCLPNECSQSEVAELFQESLEPHLWLVDRDASCQKKQTTLHRIYEASFLQKVCL